MLTTLLFDLDGTLLPLDQDYFTREYLSSLLPRLAHLMPPKEFVKHMWTATEAMIRSQDQSLTNQEVFSDVFHQHSGVEIDKLWPEISAFYEGPFGELEHLSEPTPLAAEIVAVAVEKGYEIVLATNPIFPRSATQHRMRWAGVADFPWKLVTTFEEMHACKPNLSYYQEILTKINRTAEECMMIGNSINEDMIPSQIGITTFLITDGRAKIEAASENVTYQGTLIDLLDFIKSHPVVKE